jgi:hypothetical protein
MFGFVLPKKTPEEEMLDCIQAAKTELAKGDWKAAYDKHLYAQRIYHNHPSFPFDTNSVLGKGMSEIRELLMNYAAPHGPR